MTDRELDRMMQHVLLDAIKRDCEKKPMMCLLSNQRAIISGK